MNTHSFWDILPGILLLVVLFVIDRVRKGRRGRRESVDALGMRREPGFDEQPESGLRPERIVPVYRTYENREEEIVFNTARALVKLWWIFVKWSLILVIGYYVFMILLVGLITHH